MPAILQTQPVPNPAAYFMHKSPEIVHQLETLSNHFVELIAPFLLILNRRLRIIGGCIQILFQVRKISVICFNLLVTVLHRWLSNHI